MARLLPIQSWSARREPTVVRKDDLIYGEPRVDVEQEKRNTDVEAGVRPELATCSIQRTAR